MNRVQRFKEFEEKMDWFNARGIDKAVARAGVAVSASRWGETDAGWQFTSPGPKAEGQAGLDGCGGNERGLYPLCGELSLDSREEHFFLWEGEGEGRMVFFH